MPKMNAASTSMRNWDYNNYHVQAEVEAGEFVSAESTLIASGPPKLEHTAYSMYFVNELTAPVGDTGVVYPMGICENFGVNQAQQIQRIFEIGSTRSYFIVGKTLGTITIGRILYSGPSLLKVLYAYYTQNNPAAKFQFMHHPINSKIQSEYGFIMDDPERKLLDLPEVQKRLVAIRNRAGYGDLFLNLASDLFKQPCGIMLYFRNSLDQDVGASYFETMHINAHQFSINAGSNVLMEGASGEFDRVRPVNVQLSDYMPANANI